TPPPPFRPFSYGQSKPLGPRLRGESFGFAGASHRCCVTLSCPFSFFLLLFSFFKTKP
ncbi:hypothetical protein M431DRAFT_525174, partial [Trichoderma harzianum CBS 226.95]